MKNQKNKKSEKRKISLKWKIIIPLELFILVVNLLATFLIWNTLHSIGRNTLQEKLIAIASTTAAAIDTKRHEAIIDEEDDAGLEYQEISALLGKIRNENSDIESIYTMRKTENENEWGFVVDASMEIDLNDNGVIDESEKNAKIGEIYDVSQFPQMKKAFNGAIADEDISCDKWGCWFSGYAPIYDKKGAAVAIVGVDMSASNVIAFENAVKTSAVVFLAIFVLLVPIIFYFILLSLIRPIRKISEGMKDFQKNMSTRLDIKTGDEFEAIAETFNDMASELQKLYGSMRQAVKEKTRELSNRILEIEESNAKDNAILESIADGLMATDHKGKIVMLNGRAMEILDIDNLENVLHTDYYCTIPLKDENGELVGCNSLPIRRALKDKKISYSKYGYKKANGEEMSLAITAAPILLKNKTAGVIATLRDVTKEDEVDRAKTEFVSLASHQLRTPLSMIKWYIEMLIDENVDADLKNKKYLNEINKANYRMIELVTALLNVSRIEMGTFIIEPEVTDIVEIVKEVISEIKPLTIDRKTKIETNFEDIPKISADPTLIRIVIQNLVSNAVKYTPLRGVVNISVNLKESPGSDKKDSVVIKVSDAGYGIPKAQQKNIFKKLFRADNAREKVTDGNGLGLYMTKQILENSGGSISFKSIENHGSTFVVTLPLSGMVGKKGTKHLNIYPEMKNTI